MCWKSHRPPLALTEFVFHKPTDRVGSLANRGPEGVEGQKTVRLAGGEFVSAPAGEFRPATGPEIERRHRLAAFVRPLVLPALSTPLSSAGFHRHE